MYLSRLSASGVIAAVASIGLLMLMVKLVGAQPRPITGPAAPEISFQVPDFETPAEPDRTPPPPKPPKPTPPSRPPTDIFDSEIPPPKPDVFPKFDPKSFGIPSPTGQGGGPGVSANRGPVKKLVLAPQYPPEARIRGVEGQVIVEYTVSASGIPKDIQIVSANPPRVFDKAVIRAIRRTQFDPAIENGVAISVRIRDLFEFMLED